MKLTNASVSIDVADGFAFMLFTEIEWDGSGVQLDGLTGIIINGAVASSA